MGFGCSLSLIMYDTDGNQIVSTSANDSEYSSGGIALGTASIGNADNLFLWWDHIRKVE